jgi:hypothetical protein
MFSLLSAKILAAVDLDILSRWATSRVETPSCISLIAILIVEEVTAFIFGTGVEEDKMNPNVKKKMDKQKEI